MLIFVVSIRAHGKSSYQPDINLDTLIRLYILQKQIETTFEYLFCFCGMLLLLCGDVHPNPGPHDGFVDFTICHANIRSLSPDKLRCIKTSLADSFDIIALSETFLSSTKPDRDLEIPGFHPILRRDRPTGIGGGVALYASRSLVVKRRHDLENTDLELMWIEIRLHNNKFLLAVAYRPPNSTVNFWDKLQDNMDNAKTSGIDKIMILGDLNADQATNHGNKLQHFCNVNFLTIHVNEPTRITENSSTCLDQIITNMPNFVRNVNVSAPLSNCDHCLVSANLLFRRKKASAYTRLVWEYDKADFGIFRDRLFSSDWDACFDSDNIDLICEKWTDTFMSVAKEYVPNKNVTIRPGDAPWYTSTLRASKRKVERIHKRAKLRPSLWPYFRQIRNKYIDDLRQAEENYFERLGNSINNERKRKKSWWHTVKFFLQKNETPDIPALLHDNKTFTDNEAKAQLLNEFFINQTKVDDTNFSLPAQEDNNLTNKLENISINSNEVFWILKSLDISKANGPDGISARLLREAAPAISESLAKLFNISLATCKFPSEWKKANVVPIFKKGSPSDCNNYRPISLLSSVGKVFEKAIFKHVFNFFRDNMVLSESQSGFIPGDSAVNQLVFLYHQFCQAVDLQKDVRVIFCDITKAFDRVYHPGLLYKLQRSGINGPLLQWFGDYLEERKQKVVVQGGSSQWGRVRAGVPQGSVLGPLLFLIYINDIVNIVQSSIRLFADDTTLFIRVDNATAATNILNTDLQEVETWSGQWLVSFNPTKTKSMIISKKRNPTQYPDLVFMSSTLPNETVHKHLGLTIRSDLTWSSHIKELITKGMKMVNILKYLQFRLNRKSLEILYLSFIRPLLEYGSVVWDNCTTQESTHLENVQLAAARIITGATAGTSHNLIYQESGLDKLSARREKSKLILFFKIMNSESPQYLQDLIPAPVAERNRYNVRSGSNLSLFRSRTNLFGSSFFPSAVRLWNYLPEDVRKSEDLSEFKKKLYQGTKGANILFYRGMRRIAVYHARLRMGCSNLKFDLFKKGLTDSPKCACGNHNEDVFHYFCECDFYINQRNTLHGKIIPFAPFTTQTLLFGSNRCTTRQNEIIFDAVHEYIKTTGRLGAVT